MDRHHLAQAVRRRRAEILDRFVVRRDVGNSAPTGAIFFFVFGGWQIANAGPAVAALRPARRRAGHPAEHHRGRCYFSIGLREPDSGSEIASVSTRAEPGGRVQVHRPKVWDLRCTSQPLLHRRGAPSGPARATSEGASQNLVTSRTPVRHSAIIIRWPPRMDDVRSTPPSFPRAVYSNEGERRAAGDERARL